MRKKAIMSILTVLLVAVSVFSLISCEKGDEPEEESNVITIMSDLHILASEQHAGVATKSLSRILESNEKIIGLSEAIFCSAIDDFIASDSPILILTGDLTDDGARVAHEKVAKELKRAEAAGKRCYVINGNHDINNRSKSYKNDETTLIENVTPELFATIFNDFGYAEALCRDENSLSYTAELNDKYRLIAFDVCHYTLTGEDKYTVDDRHSPDVTDEKLDWLYDRLDECDRDGKVPFLITHFPILSHVGPIAGPMSFVNRRDDVLEALDYGDVAFSFCGHVHQQDIMEYTFGDKKYYEIETGSLSFTTLPVRTFEDNGQTVEIKTKNVTAVKEEYIPAFYSEEEKAKILADLKSYVWEYEDKCFATYMYGKLDWDNIASLLGADLSTKEGKAFAQKLYGAVEAFLSLPMYKGGAGESIENICVRYGVKDFPQGLDIDVLGDLFVYFVKNNFAGDENTKPDSPQIKMLRYSVCAAVAWLHENEIIASLHAIRPDIRSIDIGPALGDLFCEGKLEVSANDLLGFVTDIPKLKKLLGKIPSPFDNIIADDGVVLAGNVKTLLENEQLMNVLFGLLADYRDIVDLVLYDGKTITDYIDFSDYETENKTYLCIGNVVDCLAESAGVGLVWDIAPSDNEFSFPSPQSGSEE